MGEDFSPHLCGGILYDLLLEARKPRSKSRDKIRGGSDGLSASNLYAGLIKVVTGENLSASAGGTLSKCASDYKKCVSSSGSYVPFTQSSTISAFDSAVKRKYSDILRRMTEFILEFLNKEKCEWLVRAIIDTLQRDTSIPNDTLFAIDYKTNMPVENLAQIDELILQPFLISVRNYVLHHSPDCESGKDTFSAWYKQLSPKSEWKFCSDIGDAIHPLKITITPMDSIDAKPNTSGGNAIYSLHVDPPKKPFVPLGSVRYDSESRVIFLESEELILPIQLLPQRIITPEELPYINALCEVYAEKLNRIVSPNHIDDLPAGLKRDLANQRKAYYSAESIYHSIRDVFADGDRQFSILKDDAYEGIEPTYYNDRFSTGYDRLQAVLEKITNTTLSKSTLQSIVGLIGNLEKKGICHILVNDRRIKSWVNIDE